MTVVMSAGQLESLVPAWTPSHGYGSMRMYGGRSRTYAALYREQPNVRVCVDFLSRNIAQLGLHVFRRVSDTDRERLTDHGLAKVIGRPLPAEFKWTRYRLIESLMSDLGIYFNAYWLKIKAAGAPLGLLRVPPELVKVQGGLVITGYRVTVGGQRMDFEPGQVVHFRGFNPENPVAGLSPLETLRRVLAEEHASGDYREHFWQNAARMQGIIKRPATAPEWSTTARERFKTEFEALYAGGNNSGTTAILEEDMEWESIQFNAQESEYLGGRKLTREECARAYHIPLPMVGILDNATFSNIKEQHKHLYQDSLGPWLAMIEGDIELQLLPEFADSEGVYCEFNIQEKLQGSFEEQATSYQGAVGRPWMTADEARARQNLPAMGGDAARLVTPLNVLVGGQASPQDSAPENRCIAPTAGATHQKAAGIDSHMPELRERHVEKWVEVLARHYRRQESAILSRLPKARAEAGSKAVIGDIWFDEERWNEELQADLFALNQLTAVTWGNVVASAAEAEVDEDRMEAWLMEHSRIQAETFNNATMAELEVALAEPDTQEAVKDLFLMATTSWARRDARTGVLSASTFGASEGARAGGLRTKTWRANSKNPRPSHAAMDGISVSVGQLFPNGMRWPGDPAGGAEEVANCACSVVFGT